MDDLASGDIDIDDVADSLAPKFVPTFKSLFSLMVAQETKLQIKQARQASQLSSQAESSGSTVISPDQDPHKPVVPTSSKRTKPSTDTLSEPTTPNQPTHPSDPKWSGSTTASKDEESTKKLLSNFLSDTMIILGADFRRIHWQQSGLKVELLQTYFYIRLQLTVRENDHMKFRLGVETITTINDGGLGIQYTRNRRPIQWQPGGIRPVLSIEVPSPLPHAPV